MVRDAASPRFDASSPLGIVQDLVEQRLMGRMDNMPAWRRRPLDPSLPAPAPPPWRQSVSVPHEYAALSAGPTEDYSTSIRPLAPEASHGADINQTEPKSPLAMPTTPRFANLVKAHACAAEVHTQTSISIGNPPSGAIVSSDLKIESVAPPHSLRRKTQKIRRRRLAVTAESSAQLASARWHSAFDALRKSEPKTSAQAALMLATLRTHTSFADLPETLLNQVVDALRTVTVASDQLVIKEGDAGDAFYLVGDGRLVASRQGCDQPVAFYKAGDTFGELALLYDCPRQATVHCISTATLYRLSRIAFRNLIFTAMSDGKVGLEKRLAAVPILSSMSPDDLSQLAEAMQTVTFESGEYITEMGAEADSLFIILSGEVVCHKATGTEMRLAEGAVFGESSLSAAVNPTREANVIAVGRVRVACLKVEDMSDILGKPFTAAIERSFCKKVVKSIRIFESLTPEERTIMLDAMQTNHVPSGSVIIEQGIIGETFFVVKRGRVDVVTRAHDGTAPRRLASLSSGGFFGERSLITDETAVASVIAVEDTEIMCISKRIFTRLLGRMSASIESEVARRDKERAGSQCSTRTGTAHTFHWIDLHVRHILGEGSFGCVRLAVHKATGAAYALKMLNKGHLIATKQIENTISEKRMLQQLQHPFILTCQGSFNTSKRHVALLLGLAQGGELFSRIAKVGTLSERVTALYISMIACALGFLSKRSIAHRDLKLENLLFDAEGYLKLVDFGFAKVVNERTWTFCGTPDYLAPEVIQGTGHNCAVDWWALGILAYEMLHGRPPFSEQADQMATFKRITRGHFVISHKVSKDASDLIRKLLAKNPARRLGMLAGGDKDVLCQPLCKRIDVSRLLQKQIRPPFVPDLQDPMDTSHFQQFESTRVAECQEFDEYLDPKLEEMWEREFGVGQNKG